MSECILWYGALDKCGYGRIGKRLAHRVAWEKANGPIPVGKVIMHSCDVRNCVNLEHLSVGTQQENIADMLEKGRGNTWRDKRGTNNHKAKLDGDIVWAIRWCFKPLRLFTIREIASSYGTHFTTIHKIWTGETWPHITQSWPFDMETK